MARLAKPEQRLLRSLFALLEHEGIRYVVAHGYQGLPERLSGDLDIIVTERGFERVGTLVEKLRSETRFEPVLYIRAGVYNISLLMAELDAGQLCLPLRTIHLDLGAALSPFNFGVYLSADDILIGRRRHGAFYVPEPHREFGLLLTKRLLKCQGEGPKLERLVALWREFPGTCEAMARRLLGGRSAHALTRILNLERVAISDRQMGSLQRALKLSLLRRRPLSVGSYRARNAVRLAARAWRPNGVWLRVVCQRREIYRAVAEGVREALGAAFMGIDLVVEDRQGSLDTRARSTLRALRARMQARMVITLASENPDDPSRAVGSKSRLADQDFPCPDVAVLLRGGEAIEPMKEMRFRIDAASPYSRSSPWRAGTIAEVVRSLARTIVDLQRAKSWEYLGHRRD